MASKMTRLEIDGIIKENMILMQQIKENREKFWKMINQDSKSVNK